MRISPYNILFHPLSPQHSALELMVSVVTVVALTIFTRGAYLGLIGVVRLSEWANDQKVYSTRSIVHQSMKRPKPTSIVNQPANHQRQPLQSLPQSDQSPKMEQLSLGRIDPEAEVSRRIIEKQKETLTVLQQRALGGDWESLAIHKDLGFDWWMFPSDWVSASHQSTYAIKNVETLKRNPAFMKSYLEGVYLVAKSIGLHGLDLETDRRYTKNLEACYWRKYEVRLGKMLYSLKQFGQMDLFLKIVEKSFEGEKIANQITEVWIQDLLFNRRS